MPVGYRRGIGCHDLVPDAPDGRFRRPAQRYQPQLRFQPAQLLDDHGLDVITALRNEPERAELVATMAGQEHLKNRRHRAPQRNAVFGHQLVPADRILLLARLRQHQCSTGGKRPKNIEDRHVVVQGRDGDEDVIFRHRPFRKRAADDIGRGPVREHDAFRLASGTGGIEVISGCFAC
ncbi:hypothetical protein D3C80_1488110 [compost metagenome]